jgi:uncharacterized protein (UPF0335 family)
MAELAQPLTRNIQVSQFAPLNPAGYFDKTPVPAPAVDTTGASDAAGKASLFSSVAKVLTDLPETLRKAYEDGRKQKIGDQVTEDFQRARSSGDSAALANFAASSAGEIKFSPQDAEMRRLQLAALANRGQTLYDKQNELLSGTPQPTPALSSIAPSSSPGGTPKATASMPGAVAASPAAPALSAVEPMLPNEEPTGDAATGILPPESFQPAGKDASKTLAGVTTVDAAPMTPPGESGGSRVKDPATGIITYTSTSGQKYELLPGANSYNEVTSKNEKETPTENALNRAIIARGKNPIGMSLEEKESFLKTEVPLKPSEKLSATKDLRQAYHELPSTTVLFGKGQMPGLNQVIERLEEIKKTAGEDFSKLTPQQGRTVVFQFSKFNDPNSAVLLSEYKAAADTLSIPDRFFQVINKASTGESVSPEQARDIYQTIRAAHERAKGNYVQDASDIMAEAKALGISNRRVGIPKQAEEWAKTVMPANSDTPEEESAAPAAPTTAAPQTVAQNDAGTRQNPILVDTAEAYAAAPSGAWVKDSNGKVGKKP